MPPTPDLDLAQFDGHTPEKWALADAHKWASDFIDKVRNPDSCPTGDAEGTYVECGCRDCAAHEELARVKLLAGERDASIEKLRVAREAIEKADACLKEINPGNYTHDDACDLNYSAIQCGLILRTALDATAENGAATGRSIPPAPPNGTVTFGGL